MLMLAQENGAPVLLTLNTGKVYIGLVVTITDPAFDPAVMTILPMFSGYRDDLGRMALTTDYESVYASLTASTGLAATNLTQFYLIIRADSIVSANQFSPALYARFHPGWRQCGGSIEEDAMHKQCYRAAALFDIVIASRGCVNFALVRKERFAAHDFCSRLASPSFRAHSSQHTSTTCAPILTLIAEASRAQSHAAQVFSVMTVLLMLRSIGHA